MPVYTVQNTLNGGELDKTLLARVDLPRYQTGAQTMRNFVPIPQGGCTRRPGMEFLGLTATPAAPEGHVALHPFVFSETQGRVLEFSGKAMRVWLNNGRLVLKNGAPFALALPYAAEHVRELSLAQSGDVIYVAHREYAPAKICRYADDDWRYESINFLPAMQPPSSLSVEALGEVPGSGSQTYSYKVTAISAETGAESKASPAQDITCSSQSATYFVRVSWPSVSGALEYRVYKKKGGTYGFIGRAVEGATSFDDKNTGPDTEDTPPAWKNPFDGAGKYPSLTFYHQQRLGFAASKEKPMTVWLSKSADFENFSTATPPKDDDSIEATLAARQANRIQWVEPATAALMIGTEGSEWTFGPKEGEVITPLDMNFKPQSSCGSSSCRALPMDSGIVFIQRGSSTVRETSYNFQADKFIPQDLTLLAPHVLRDVSVVQWAYQQVPHSIIWCVLSNGTMAGLTLMREHEVIGWHRHDTDGRVEGICVIPGMPDDQTWLLVRRTSAAGERLHVERLAPFFNGEAHTANHLDSSLVYSGAPEAVLSGMGHLEGREVAAFADGSAVPAQAVHGGAVSLPYAARVAALGLPFVSELIPTRPEMQTQGGHSLMHQRRILAVNVRVYKSMAFSYGTTGTRMFTTGDRMLEEQTSLTPDFDQARDVTLPLGGGFDQGDVRIVSGEALPLTILCIGSTLDIAPQSGSLR